MLEKRDIIYYYRLAYTQGIVGAIILALCFVAGVAAKYHMAEIHLFAPYWVGLPMILQAVVTYAAAKTGKRWPLGIWLPLFIVTLVAIAAFMVVMPPFKVGIFDKYPCYVQHNYKLDKVRCICSYSSTNYLKVDGADTITPCIRGFDIMILMSNISYMFTVLSLIPELLMFVLVCNDLCCVTCHTT